MEKCVMLIKMLHANGVTMANILLKLMDTCIMGTMAGKACEKPQERWLIMS